MTWRLAPVATGTWGSLPLVIAMLMSTAARSQERSFYSEPEVHRYLDRHRSCYAWAFAVHQHGLVIPHVFCVFDGVRAAGGIDARQECMAGILDVRTGDFSNTEPSPLVERKCSAAAVKELMGKYYSRSWLAYAVGGANVERGVFGGVGGRLLRESACALAKEPELLQRYDCTTSGGTSSSSPRVRARCKRQSDCPADQHCTFDRMSDSKGYCTSDTSAGSR